MKIGLAQTHPVTGNIAANIQGHLRLIEKALEQGADWLMFPELSLTAYEPNLAAELATHPDDPRLEVFQEISDSRGLSMGLGLPLRQPAGIQIGMVIFQPGLPRQTYVKQFLHEDEEPFFIPGQGSVQWLEAGRRIAPAICYEISVPEHAERAHVQGAEVYLASVVKFVHSMDKAEETLSGIARRYGMYVLMANSVGLADGLVCGGKSSVWSPEGKLLAQLDAESEGVLVVDI